MPRSSTAASSPHTLSSATYITGIAESSFRYTQAAERAEKAIVDAIVAIRAVTLHGLLVKAAVVATRHSTTCAENAEPVILAANGTDKVFSLAFLTEARHAFAASRVSQMAIDVAHPAALSREFVKEKSASKGGK